MSSDAIMQPAAEEEEQNAMQLDGEDVTSDNEDSATVNRKRELRASYRELGQEAVDAQGNINDTTVDDLSAAIKRADSLWKKVAGPAEAVLDSKVLMATSAAGATKARQLKIDSNAFDTTEFLSRLVRYMGGARAQNKGKKKQAVVKGEDDDDDEDEGDQTYEQPEHSVGGYTWDKVGRLLAGESRRVPTIDLMYGPLELEIKQKKARVRVAREKINEADRQRPEELQATDLEASKNETGRMVREIGRVLDSVGVEGIPYLHFVTNPQSFAQTVENVFYLSFLVRENKCCIEMEDKPDSPFCGDLIVFGAEEPDEDQLNTTNKQQLVFEITEKLWQDAIEAYNITESVIPHREGFKGGVKQKGKW